MADGTGDPHVLAPGTAPTPFTAAQVRDGARAGKEIRVRVEAAGETPYFRVNRYLECEEAGAVLERFHLALDGSPIGELDCLRYTVREGATENVFWFATDLPGMPVRFVTRIDGEVELTVSMVSQSMP